MGFNDEWTDEDDSNIDDENKERLESLGDFTTKAIPPNEFTKVGMVHNT